MSLSQLAEGYFGSMSPISAKIQEDIADAKSAYENIWDSLSDKEKNEVINESIIKPEVAVQYALLDNFVFNMDNTPIKKDDLMSFFGNRHGQSLVHDENKTWRDEHSAPFLYQTKSQLNLCILSDERKKTKDIKPSSPHVQPALIELANSHSKVVSELKNALKSYEAKKNTQDNSDKTIGSPSNFLSKLIGNFKNKDEEKQALVAPSPQRIVSPENAADGKHANEYRNSMLKSHSDMSEENRGLLSNMSQASSSTEFQSCEEIPSRVDSIDSDNLQKTGYDFLDNW